MKSGRSARYCGMPELNITAFMNLMVALVPFLLINAVFTQVSILQLVSAQGSDNGDNAKEPLQLEVVIRNDGLSLNNAAGKAQRLADIDKHSGGYDYKRLTEELYKVKQRYPDKTGITLRAEEETTYETIVQLMDTVRVRRVSQGMSTVELELFPDISIDDAEGGGSRS